MPIKRNGGTDVVANGTPSNAVSLSSLRSQLGNYAVSAPRVRGGGSYLNFSKGDWTYGQARKPLDLDAVWLVNPSTLQHGYICWRDVKIFHEVLLPIGSMLPAEISLPEPPAPRPGSDDQEGYQYQIGFSCTCIEGPYAGNPDTATGHFKSSSVGGTGAIQSMIDDLNARLDECEATGNPAFYPVIQFGSDSYMHKTRGKIFVPTISIIGFSDNVPGHEPEWLETEEEETPPPAPSKTVRTRRTAG